MVSHYFANDILNRPCHTTSCTNDFTAECASNDAELYLIYQGKECSTDHNYRSGDKPFPCDNHRESRRDWARGWPMIETLLTDTEFTFIFFYDEVSHFTCILYCDETRKSVRVLPPPSTHLTHIWRLHLAWLASTMWFSQQIPRQYDLLWKWRQTKTK